MNIHELICDYPAVVEALINSGKATRSWIKDIIEVKESEYFNRDYTIYRVKYQDNDVETLWVHEDDTGNVEIYFSVDALKSFDINVPEELQ